MPINRGLYADFAGGHAATVLASADGRNIPLNGFTDTQLRAAYTLGRDRAVISIRLNLPTGEERVDTAQLRLLRVIAQNSVPFPVSTYGAGMGVTGGAALAQQCGRWSLGLAASARSLGRYSPFIDVDDTYRPGLEARLRIGARLVAGRGSSIAAGLALSTFAADECGGMWEFTYRSGNRYVAQLRLGFLACAAELRSLRRFCRYRSSRGLDDPIVLLSQLQHCVVSRSLAAIDRHQGAA